MEWNEQNKERAKKRTSIPTASVAFHIRQHVAYTGALSLLVGGTENTLSWTTLIKKKGIVNAESTLSPLHACLSTRHSSATRWGFTKFSREDTAIIPSVY